MIDEPGPWGTGPFTLVQGASSILTRNVIMYTVVSAILLVASFGIYTTTEEIDLVSQAVLSPEEADKLAKELVQGLLSDLVPPSEGIWDLLPQHRRVALGRHDAALPGHGRQGPRRAPAPVRWPGRGRASPRCVCRRAGLRPTIAAFRAVDSV